MNTKAGACVCFADAYNTYAKHRAWPQQGRQAVEQEQACKLYIIDGAPAPHGQSGLTKAIIELCVRLGSDTNAIVQQEGYINDVPATDGWVVITDLEGTEAIWCDGRRLATIKSCARAGWFAYATLANGTRLYSEGSSCSWESEPWCEV